MVSRVDFDEARRRAGALATSTSLGVGGAPTFWFEPEDEVSCARVVRACRRAGVPLYVLGGGYNLLVDDGPLEGAVLSTRGLRSLAVYEDRVEVGAGRSFPELVRGAADLRIPALPGCPGIPGSVGGVVFMNAGGRFGSVADALIEVSGVDPEGGPFRRFLRPGDLGYRRSIFRGCLVTGAVFRRDPSLDVDALRELNARASAYKRSTQPLAARSAGCVFKNPAGPDGGPSAGRLIDEAGLKGRRVGGAMVSPVHANFIVNVGGATARDVHDLIETVRAVVRERHGVELELEVQTWSDAQSI